MRADQRFRPVGKTEGRQSERISQKPQGNLGEFRIFDSIEKVPLIQDPHPNAAPTKAVTYVMSLMTCEPSQGKLDGGLR